LIQIRANVTREKGVRFTNQEIVELLQSWRKKGRFDLEAGRLKPES